MRSILLIPAFALFTLGCCGITPESLGGPVTSDECATLPILEASLHNYTEAETECYQDKYILSAYFGNTDYERCEEIISPGYRAVCYGAYAAFEKNASKCSRFIGPAQNDLCVFTYAVHVENVTMCGRLSDPQLKALCIADIPGTTPVQTGGPTVSDLCVSLPASAAEDYTFSEAERDCYLESYLTPAYFGDKDFDDCDEILDDVSKMGCYAACGAFLNDSSRCKEFTEPLRSDLCLYLFAVYTEDPSACDQVISDSFREECLQKTG